MRNKKSFRVGKTHLLITAFFGLLLTLTACLDDLLNDKIQDLIPDTIPIAHIATGVSVGVFDYQTKELINGEVTLLIHPTSAQHTIDLYSSAVDSITFTGGVYNIGIKNSTVPTPDAPLHLIFAVRTAGYLDKAVSISLSDTGMVHFDVELFHEDNLPESISVSEHIAPVDDLGNPMPLPFPYDSTGQLVSDGSGRLLAGNSITTPLLYPPPTAELPWTWTYLESVNSWTPAEFTGVPAAYRITAHAWNGIPEQATAYYDPDQPQLQFAELFEIIKFEIKETSSGDFKQVALAQPSGLDVEIIGGPTVSYVSYTPNLGNANTWLNKFLEGSADGLFRNSSFAFWFGDCFYFCAGEVEQYVNNRNQISFAEWFFNWATYSSTELSLYTLFANQSDTSELMQKQYVSQMNPYEQAGVMFFPMYSYKIYTSIKTGNVDISVAGYGSQQQMQVEILSGGQTKTGTDTSDDGAKTTIAGVPRRDAKITVKLPEGNYSVYYDLTNYTGETITINVPSRSANLINTTVAVTLGCQTSSKSVRVKEIPNTSIRYRKQGSTGAYQVGTINSWNFDQSSNKLTGLSISAQAVEQNATYDILITIAGQKKTGSFTVTSASSSTSITIPDEFCTN